ncbi:hypothetical protein Tco_0877644 [Tanacetum coccineum]|uniref:Uncharacterized protein n=1 Tax=Tanacetum coccineum TaxID=301880 RepID=A0ABQ5BX56_9ASTR
MIARKKPRKQSDDGSDDEHRKCLKIVTFEGTLDSEIMEKKSVIARLDKVSSPDGDYLVIYRANGNFRAFNYLMEGSQLTLLHGEELASPRSNSSCNEALASPKANDKVADKDGKIIKDQDQDVLKCLDTSSKNLRRLT